MKASSGLVLTVHPRKRRSQPEHECGDREEDDRNEREPSHDVRPHGAVAQEHTTRILATSPQKRVDQERDQQRVHEAHRREERQRRLAVGVQIGLAQHDEHEGQDTGDQELGWDT
jgi:hypothetical protein